MLRKILIVLLILFLLTVLAGLSKIIQLSWITVDMGWCQKYGNGLKILNKVIFEFPQKGFSICV